MELSITAPAAGPRLKLVDVEADLLADLALVMESQSPTLARRIRDDVRRAKIVPSRELPPDTVRIGSEIELVAEATGRTCRLRLVLPFEADSERGAISVLTDAGAGLIGLCPGQYFSWPGQKGEARLRIVSVRPPRRGANDR